MVILVSDGKVFTFMIQNDWIWKLDSPISVFPVEEKICSQLIFIEMYFPWKKKKRKVASMRTTIQNIRFLFLRCWTSWKYESSIGKMLLVAGHFLSCIKGINPFSEKEPYLWFYSGKRKNGESQKGDRDPLDQIGDIIIPAKPDIASHDVNRENAGDDDRGEEDRKYDRGRNGNSEGCKRMVDWVKYSWNVSDEKENQWSSCPKEVILDEVEGFSELFEKRNSFIFVKLRDDIFYISTTPWPSSELFVLWTNGTVECWFIHEVHFADCWCMNDTKKAIPSKVCSPVLESIFYNGGFWPIIRLVETMKSLSIDCKISVKFGILTLKELPQSRTSCNNSCEKGPACPIVWIDGRKLKNRLIRIFCSEKGPGDDWKKPFFDFCVRIDCGDESFVWVENMSFFVLFQGVSDISSFYLAFIHYILWMNDVVDLYGRILIFSDDCFSKFLCVWCACFSSKENSDIFLIEILGVNNCIDIFFYDIERFCIYRYNDYMDDFFCFFS